VQTASGNGIHDLPHMNQPHPFDAAIHLEPQREGHWCRAACCARTALSAVDLCVHLARPLSGDRRELAGQGVVEEMPGTT
jgi:hypothetical protein